MPSIILGRAELGEKGFSQMISTQTYCDYYASARQILDCLSPRLQLVMTSLTSSELLEESGYLPRILRYAPCFDNYLDPISIFDRCLSGDDGTSALADFIVWNSVAFPNLAVATYSRTAPIITIESENGYKAIGTVLRPSLLTHGCSIFTNLFKHMEGKIVVTLSASTYFRYSEGIIYYTLRRLMRKFPKKKIRLVRGEDCNANPNLFGENDKPGQNHVVVLYSEP